jgi:hypothetical protein
MRNKAGSQGNDDLRARIGTGTDKYLYCLHRTVTITLLAFPIQALYRSWIS